jgi:hypothetical protein
LTLSTLELKTLNVDDVLDFLEIWERKTGFSHEQRSIVECLSPSIRRRLEGKAAELLMPGMHSFIGNDNKPTVTNDEVLDIISEYLRPDSKTLMKEKFKNVKFPPHEKSIFAVKGARLEHFDEIHHLINGVYYSLSVSVLGFLTYNGKGTHLLPAVYTRNKQSQSKGLVNYFLEKIPEKLGDALLAEMNESELEDLNSFEDFRLILEHTLNGFLKLQHQVVDRVKHCLV